MLTELRMQELYDLKRNFDGTRGFLSSSDEYQFDRLQIEGYIPSEIRGTFYLAGPGKFNAPSGEQYVHIFDGDGMIAAFSLEAGNVSFTSRFIRTPAYDAELKAGYRKYGSFAMASPKGIFGLPQIGAFKNSVNHGISWVNGRLLAVNDGALPFEINPYTLETLGIYNFNGGLSKFGLLASHAHWLNESSEAYFLMTNLIGLHPSVTVYLTNNDGYAQPLATHPLRHLTFIHDFALTQNHIVISVGSLVIKRIQLLKWLFGLDSLLSSFQWQENLPNEILLLRRTDGSLVRRYFTDPSFYFHFANSYDDENGDVIVDLACYEDSAIVTKHLAKFLRESSTPEEFRHSMPELKRLRLTNDGSIKLTNFTEVAMEFAVFPDDMYAQKHRFLYPLDVGCYARLLKLDTLMNNVQAVDYGTNMFGSESTFIRKSNSQSEDDGWLLICMYDSTDQHSFLSVVDALTMKEVGRAHLPIHVPLRFHATFVNDVIVKS